MRVSCTIIESSRYAAGNLYAKGSGDSQFLCVYRCRTPHLYRKVRAVEGESLMSIIENTVVNSNGETVTIYIEVDEVQAIHQYNPYEDLRGTGKEVVAAAKD